MATKTSYIKNNEKMISDIKEELRKKDAVIHGYATTVYDDYYIISKALGMCLDRLKGGEQR